MDARKKTRQQIEAEGGTERRGFAAMSLEQRRAIAAKGGRKAHENGTAHRWTPSEAANAGRIGGTVSRGGRGKVPASA
jgi:general stress protein YciG